ncbi:MAG TPA: Ig-like domain-containing protein, partial [Anaerolineae bacterium]|nr:Ig-like domain-containing protein [Anaerolineae bacterium]
MSTHTARPLWQRWLSAITILVMAVGMIPLSPPQPVLAATQTLGGDAVEGNLRVEVYDEGSIGIFRYDPTNVGDEWETLVYNGSDVGSAEDPNKFSRLQYNGGGAGNGYYFSWPDSVSENGDDAQATSVSNTTVGNTIVTVFTAGSTQVTQTVTYHDGDDFIRYDWAIQNMTGSALNDLRFFHGMDTCLGGMGYYCDYDSDTGRGFWMTDARAVGVRNLDGALETSIYLQSVTPPFGYDSQEWAVPIENMANGALSNTVDPNDVDNVYALEWRRNSLAADAVWTISAYERFTLKPFDAVSVAAPILTEVEQGDAVNLHYILTNYETTAVDVALSVSHNPPTWTVTLQGPTTISVPGNSEITVTVQVTVPATANIGATGAITLTADSDAAPPDSGDRATVRVIPETILPPLDISKTAEDLNGAPLRVGDPIRYTLRVTNTTASPMTGVRVTDTLPFSVTFGSATPAGYTGPNPLVWEVGGLDTLAVWTGSITVTVADGATAIGGNVAEASSDGHDVRGTGAVLPPDGGAVEPAVVPPPTVTTPISGTATNDTTPAFTGVTDPGAAITVTLHPTGTTFCAAATDGNGDWTCAPAAPLVEGRYTFAVIAGNGVSESDPTYVILTVDTTPPLPPEVTTPFSGTAVMTYTPTFAGTGEPGGVITLYDEGHNVVCAAVADGSGDWTCTPPAPLPEGAQTYQITVTDAAGNESAPTPHAIRIDTTAPPPPNVTSPLSGTAVMINPPLFAGNGEPSGDVTIYDEGGSVICTAGVALSGNWTCMPAAPLAEGAQTYRVTVTDEAGNESTPTLVVLIVDTIPPAPPTVTHPLNGAILNDATPTFSGTAEAEAGITVMRQPTGTVLCTAAADGNGDWTCTPTASLPEGSHTFAVIAGDAAGHESAPTYVTITLDLTPPPAPTVISPISGTVVMTHTPTFTDAGEIGGVITLYNALSSRLCT